MYSSEEVRREYQRQIGFDEFFGEMYARMDAMSQREKLDVLGELMLKASEERVTRG
jgi:hypothetical protein